MEKQLFDELLSSVQEAVDISHGIQVPSRKNTITSTTVQQLREKTGLSQRDLAQLMQVSVKTLQNWEQGRRNPTGPAAVLIRIFEKAPDMAKLVLQS